MATYRTLDFSRALTQKGFVVDQTHHNMFWLLADGRKTQIRTRVSHGEKTFDDSLASQRRKQLGGLSKDQMRDFIECPLTKEQYLAFVVQNRLVQLRGSEDGKAGPSSHGQT